MKVDGAAGKASCGAGIMLKNKEGLQIEHAIHFNFQTTNNIAEYEALLAELDLAKELEIRTLEVYTDSQLVANQIEGSYETKDQSLRDYKELATNTIKEFKSVRTNLVKRDYVEDADVLAKLGATKNIKEDKWVQVRTLSHSALQKAQENLEITTSEDDWRTPITNFILDIAVQENSLEARKVKNQTAHYAVQNRELYRRETKT